MKTILSFLILLLSVQAGLSTDVTYLPSPGKVAFIGNSLTLFNCGSDTVVKKLGDALPVPLKLTLDQRVQTGGFTLKDHWTVANRNAISNAHLNMVVMQEGGDWTYSTNAANAEQFYQYGTLWADLIRKSGATPALYMMWAWREDVGDAMKAKTDHHANQYDTMSRKIRAKVIPIGRGYYKLRNDPSPIAQSINLFVDYQHPSSSATYFIGCIAFAALYNISPVGNPYVGAGLSSCMGSPNPTKAQAQYMQAVAWETWLEFGGDDAGRAWVPPRVSIDFRTDSGLTLSWPDSASDWPLYSAGSLEPPVTWSPVTNGSTTANGRTSVSLPATGGLGYFRIASP